MSKRIFITGGTGFIGHALATALARRGDMPVVLTRDWEHGQLRVGTRARVVEGDPAQDGPWYDEIAGCDAIVNLAGAPLSGRRWTADYMRTLRDSRVQTTRALVRAIAATPERERPRALVSASAVDCYPFEETLVSSAGWQPDEEVTEEAPHGDTFLGRLCRAWEAEALRAQEHGVRVVLLRTGVVLGPRGALPLMARAFKLYLGGPLGSGKQWFSWIHIDDLVAAYLRAVDDEELRGPVNAVAPGAVRNREFAQALGGALGRPVWLPAPRLALRLALGPLAEYLTHGRRVVPAALMARGFDFAYPDIGAALVQATHGPRAVMAPA